MGVQSVQHGLRSTSGRATRMLWRWDSPNSCETAARYPHMTTPNSARSGSAALLPGGRRDTPAPVVAPAPWPAPAPALLGARPASGFAGALSFTTSVAAAGLALLYFVCRAGAEENPVTPLGLAVGVDWFLVNAGFGARWVVTSVRGRLPETWLLSDGALTLATLLLLAGLGAWAGELLGFPVAVCGAALFLARGLRTLAPIGWVGRLGLLAAASVLALFLGSIIWGFEYLHPLYVPGLSLGLGHRDELFHAAIANMIGTYGVPSTGLDGLVFNPYHYGSHALFAQSARLIQLPVLDFYRAGLSHHLPPLLCPCRGAGDQGVPGPRHRGPRLPLPSRVLHSPCDPDRGVRRDASRDRGQSTVLLPERGDLGIDVCRPNRPVAGPVGGLAAAGTRLDSARSLSRLDAVSAALAFPALVVGLTFVKISVGAVLLGAAGLLFVRTRLWRGSWLAAGSLAAGCLSFLLILPLVIPGGADKSAGGLMPLAYLRDYVPAESWLFSLVLQYSWLLAVIVLRLWQCGVKTVGDLANALRSGRLIDIEFLTLLALVGCLPGLFWRIAGGSAAYFFGIQRWVALPVLLAAVLSADGTVPRPAAAAWRGRLRTISLSHCLAGFLFAIGLGNTLLNTVDFYIPAIFSRDLMLRGFFMPRNGKDEAAPMREQVKDALLSGKVGDTCKLVESVTRDTDQRQDPRLAVVRTLRAIDRLPRGDKRATASTSPRETAPTGACSSIVPVLPSLARPWRGWP